MMETVGFWEWFWLLLLFFIPIVNIVVLLIGVFGVGKRSFVNYCRAILLWGVIGIGIAIVYGLLTGAISG